MGDVDKLQEAEEWAGQQEQQTKSDEAAARAAELSEDPVEETAARPWRMESIALSKIADRDNVRLDMPKIHQLALSIRQRGLTSPITVRPDEDSEGGYVVVTGHRRLGALRELYTGGEADTYLVGCKVIENLTEAEVFALMLTENEQRVALEPLQAARAARHLLDLRPEMTAEELAKSLGITKSKMTNWFKLLDLPDIVQDLLERGDLSFTVANMLRTAQGKGTIDEMEASHLATQIAQGDRSYSDVKAQIAPPKPREFATVPPVTVRAGDEITSVTGGKDSPFDNDGNASTDSWDQNTWEAQEQRAQDARSEYLESEANRLLRENPIAMSGPLPTARPAAGNDFVDTTASEDDGQTVYSSADNGDEPPSISPVRDQLHAMMVGRMLRDWADDDYLTELGVDRDDAIRYSLDLPYPKRVYLFYNLAATIGTMLPADES